MRKIIKLTGIAEKVKEEVQERLDVEEQDMPTMFEDLVCDNGYSRSWYEDMGIKVPQDLIEKEKYFKLGAELDDEDFEVIEYPFHVFLDEIIGYIDEDVRTVVYIKGGTIFQVKEKAEEIYKKINNKCNIICRIKNKVLSLQK